MREAINLPTHKTTLYSSLVRTEGKYVFLSGCVGIREDGALGDSFREQTELAIHNMKTALAAANSDINHIARIIVFLTDYENMKEFNDIYKTHFSSLPPARSCIFVGLAPGYLVELNVTAVEIE